MFVNNIFEKLSYNAIDSNSFNAFPFVCAGVRGEHLKNVKFVQMMKNRMSVFGEKKQTLSILFVPDKAHRLLFYESRKM